MALGQLEKRIAALAAPTLVALLVEPLYNLTDTAIVGHLGRAPLGGLAIATAILTVVVAGSGFLSMATAPRVAFLRGSGDMDSAAEAAKAAYWIALMLGVGLGLAVGLLAGPLATLAGGHGHIHHDAVVYIRVAAGGIPFVLFIVAGTGHLRGLADARTPLVIILASNVVNVVAELVLVYAAGMGIVGSALGTVLAQIVGALIFVAVSTDRGGVRLWKGAPRRDELVRLISAGGVLIVRTLALLVAWSGSTAIASRLGSATLGGHQIALQVWFLVGLSLDALAVPAQILVGEALGASGSGAAERVARTVLRSGVVVAVGLAVGMAAISQIVPAIFTSDHAVRHQATLALLVGAATLPFGAVAFELDGVLLGSGDLRFLRRTMVIALIGFVPLAALTLADHRLGIVGIWGAIMCWMGARAAILTGRWRSGRWLPDQGRPAQCPAR
jgi:putative MATE family efflux protein